MKRIYRTTFKKGNVKGMWFRKSRKIIPKK